MTPVLSTHVPLGRLASVHSSTFKIPNWMQMPSEQLPLHLLVTEQSTELGSIGIPPVIQYPSAKDPSLGAQ